MGVPTFGRTRRIMETPNTHFEGLLDQVEQLHQAIASEDQSMGTLAQMLRARLDQAEAAAAWLDLIEPLRWWKTSVQTPPLDHDVLVAWGDDRGIYMAAWLGDEGGWVGADSIKLESEPRYWAALPRGPVDRIAPA